MSHECTLVFLLRLYFGACIYLAFYQTTLFFHWKEDQLYPTLLVIISLQSLQCDIILNNLILVSNYDVVLHVAVYMCHFSFHCSRIQKKLIHH